MDAPRMLQRMRIRSQLLIKPHSSTGLRRQPSLQSYRSEDNRSSHSVFNQTFRSKFQRMLKQKKVHIMLDTQHSQKVYYNSTSKANEISKEVTKSKKSLNDLIVQRKSLQNNSKRLKFEIEKLKNEKKSINESQVISQTDVKFLIKRDRRLSHIEEHIYHDALCYEETKLRNQKDLIIWKARYQELTRYHQQYDQIIKQLFNQQSSLIQTQSDIYSTLQSTRNMVDQAAESKEQVLLVHKFQIEDKRDIDNWKIGRGKQKEEFKQLAGVQQQKEQIMEYREYYLANKFLLKMLRSKRERIMERFKHHHVGFEYIRQNTGLSNTNSILERMQVQDQLYEDRLKQIKELEDQIKLIEEKQSVQLSKNYLQVQSRSEGFKERQLDDKLERLRVLKAQKAEEIKGITKFEALLKNWIEKSRVRMSIEESSTKQPKDAIQKILQKLSKQLKNI